MEHFLPVGILVWFVSSSELTLSDSELSTIVGLDYEDYDGSNATANFVITSIVFDSENDSLQKSIGRLLPSTILPRNTISSMKILGNRTSDDGCSNISGKCSLTTVQNISKDSGNRFRSIVPKDLSSDFSDRNKTNYNFDRDKSISHNKSRHNKSKLINDSKETKQLIDEAENGENYTITGTPKQKTITELTFNGIQQLNETPDSSKTVGIKIAFDKLEPGIEYEGSLIVRVSNVTSQTFPYSYTYFGDNKLKLKIPIHLEFSMDSDPVTRSQAYGEIVLNYNADDRRVLVIVPNALNSNSYGSGNLKFSEAKPLPHNDTFFERYVYYKNVLKSIFGTKQDLFSASKNYTDVARKVIMTIPLFVTCVILFWVNISIIQIGMSRKYTSTK